MLAQRISSMNAFSALCEETGADIDEVAYVLGTDHRIGKYFLKAGPGFGGSCFKKDVLNLVYLCRSYGLEACADYWEQVVEMNETQQRRIVERTVRLMFNTLAGKRIALFGFAFKANTGDTRETPALAVAHLLADEHAELVVTDPKALANAMKDLEGIQCVTFEDDPYQAAVGADAILLMTEWECYKTLNWEKIYALMRKPALLFDTRNILDHKRLKDIGFNTLAVGKIV
jgi:UDPglucose 6-dehydrogenase